LAQEESAEALIDEYLIELERKPKDKVDAANKRTRLEMLKWIISKRNPRMYSDKMLHDVTVKTIDLTRIINAAEARLVARAPAIDIDAVIIPKLEDLL
jgi:hypothetical protein